MSYTITPVLGAHQDKSGASKIYLRIIYDRKKIEVPTGLKIPPENFEDGKVVKHKNKVLFNNRINEERHKLEGILIDIKKPNIDKDELKEIVLGKKVEVKKSDTLVDFIYDTCDKRKGKWSEGYIEQPHAVAAKLSRFAPNITLKEVSVTWLQSFEKYIRDTGISENTIAQNMKTLLMLLRIAHLDENELIDSKQFIRYKPPVQVRHLHTYLKEEEIERFETAMWAMGENSAITAGMYFLFSCRAGFRISDAKSFDYNKSVVRNTIVLRAQKNKKIVSIPIYPKLAKILDWIKDHKFDMTEPWGNTKLRQIAKKAGIDKHITFHVGRHTFAQGLSDKGFSEDDIAAQLGDTREIAKVYATVSNERLERKYRELMF